MSIILPQKSNIPKSPNGWWDLSTCWDVICSIGEQRHQQKDSFKSTRAWNNKSHIIGVLGEFVISLESGIEFDTELKINGDNGSDFKINNKTIDIKCATFFKDPDLKHPAQEIRWPDYFVLVALNEPRKKARLMGWALGDKVRNSRITNYGYGPQKILNWSELNPGLLPVFKIGK